MDIKIANKTKSGSDNSSLWTFLGAALLSACGGGGGGGGGGASVGRGCGPHVVYNGSAICDQPFGDALIFNRVNGELFTPPSSSLNRDLEFERLLLADPSINSANFDADYNITIISTTKGSTSAANTNIINANVPTSVKDITPSQTDKDAWVGFDIVEGGKSYGPYYLNRNTGQTHSEIVEDTVSSLNNGENILIEIRSSFTVRTLELNGVNAIRDIYDPIVINAFQNEGYEVVGNTFTAAIWVWNFFGVNDLPTSQDVTINISSGAAMYDGFLVSHFAFNDLDDGDFQLMSILISRAPVSGNLTLERGVDEEPIAVNQGDRVERADIANLVYTPNNTLIDDTFDFRVNDGEADSSASYTVTLDVA